MRPYAGGWSVSPLAWDSEFWGCRVGRLQASREVYEAASIDAAIGESFDFVYLLADAGRIDLIGSAEEAGFRTVDVRCEVSLITRGALLPTSTIAQVRSPTDSEFEDAVALAGGAHRGTRFGEDDFIAPRRVSDFYQTWMRRDHGLPDWTTLVALVNGDVAGYVTHGPRTRDVATIGLIAVHPNHRGRGVGSQLLGAAANQQCELGRPRMDAVTQGGSVAAMSMYRRAGFSIGHLGIWLHWHRSGAR